MSSNPLMQTLGAFAAICGLLLARPARAQPSHADAPILPNTASETNPYETSSSNGADAGLATQFARAVQLYKEGKIEQALSVFRAVSEASASPNALLYVGHCLVRLARYVEAHGAFSLTLTEIGRRNDDRYEETREAATAQLSWLALRVGKLIVALADVPAGLTVLIDGAPISNAELGSEIVLSPGVHRVQIEAENMKPVHRDVEVPAGASKTITVAFEKVEARAAPVGSVDLGAVDLFERRRTYRVLGVTAAGVGVVGLAVFTVAGLKAKNTYELLERDCVPDGCSERAHRDRIHQGKSEQTIANIGLAVGALGAVAGGALLYLGLAQDSERNLALTVTSRHAGLAYRTRF